MPPAEGKEIESVEKREVRHQACYDE